MINTLIEIENIRENFNTELSTYDDFCEISRDFEISELMKDILKNEN